MLREKGWDPLLYGIESPVWPWTMQEWTMCKGYVTCTKQKMSKFVKNHFYLHNNYRNKKTILKSNLLELDLIYKVFFELIHL